ncbi:hypothetical protein PQX77_021311 [Marasmius sp. AFHP31]|nr:hypothetical protein PQX77_021311 [Marasmius sp. AFHP31]
MSGVGEFNILSTAQIADFQSPPGYKQREKISKALRARAEAIRKALDTYNDLATQVNPPRPTLTFNEIVEMVSVADFDLLKDTQHNVSELIWAREEHREAMHLHFWIRRAREEIYRLNIELKRLITFMLDDHADYHQALKATQCTDPDLAAELARQQSYRVAIHTHIVQRLAQTSALRGFTGCLLPGERLYRDSAATDMAPLPPWSDIIGLEVAGLDEVQPEEAADSDGLISFMQGLAITQAEQGEYDGIDPL